MIKNTKVLILSALLVAIATPFTTRAADGDAPQELSGGGGTVGNGMIDDQAATPAPEQAPEPMPKAHSKKKKKAKAAKKKKSKKKKKKAAQY